MGERSLPDSVKTDTSQGIGCGSLYNRYESVVLYNRQRIFSELLLNEMDYILLIDREECRYASDVSKL
jgi:hypothetical protein